MMMRLSSIKLVLLISVVCAKMKLEDMKTAFEGVFGRNSDLEYSIINPLFGHMFRTNGCLENIRFYSSEITAKYDDKEMRDYKLDQSEDSLTNLIIHLFPSHNGTFNSLRRIELNFTNKYFILNQCYCDKKKIDRIENIKMLGETFVRLVSGGTNRNPRSKARTPYALFEDYVFSPSNTPGLEDINLKLLVIHAYVLDILDGPEEFKIYLKAIYDRLSDIAIREHLVLTEKQKESFRDLYTNPFKFPYSKVNQPASNSSISIYDRKENKFIEDKRFSDCVDITILHLCNCLFYNEETGECILAHLKPEGKAISDECIRLLKFYKKYHYKPFEITQEMRNDWSKVVQGLSNNGGFDCTNGYKPYVIRYIKTEYNNELDSGIINIMSVLAKICNAEKTYKDIMTSGRVISKNSIARKFVEFLNKLSSDKIEIAVNENEIKDAEVGKKDFVGNFKMTFNLKSKRSIEMSLKVLNEHAGFSFEESKGGSDFSPLLEGLKSSSSRYLLCSLLNRYAKLLSGKDDKTTGFSCVFDALYNQGILQTNEQKRDQLAHLVEYIDGNEAGAAAAKRSIANIVRSADLSDTATKEIFEVFFIFVKDLFDKMTNDQVIDTWLSFYKRDLVLKEEKSRDYWNQYIANSDSMKVRDAFFFSNIFTFDNLKIILSVLKGKVTNLSLSGYNSRLVSPQEPLKTVKNFLRNDTVLTKLSLADVDLSSEDIAEIFNVIEDGSALTALEVLRTGNKGIKPMFDALKNNTTLRELSVQRNNLGDIDCKYIAEALKENKHLTKLDISGNKIGESGIKLLAEALKSNTALETLDISDNKIGESSIKLLAETLKSNKALKTLDISDNDLGDMGAKHIADGLEENKSLRILNIWNCKISLAGIRLIANGIKRHKSLKKLTISKHFREAYKEFEEEIKKKEFELIYLEPPL